MRPWRRLSLERMWGPGASSSLETAVRDAESHTSAELAIFIREYSFLRTWFGLQADHAQVRAKAEQLFVRHGLDKTAERNAVMVYVSLRERALVVLGDEGIHQRMGTPAWESLVAEALQEAKAHGLLQSFCVLVRHLGEQLGQHFPRRTDDRNELPDAPNVR